MNIVNGVLGFAAARKTLLKPFAIQIYRPLIAAMTIIILFIKGLNDVT